MFLNFLTPTDLRFDFWTANGHTAHRAIRKNRSNQLLFLRAKAATASVCLSVCHTGGSVKSGAS